MDSTASFRDIASEAVETVEDSKENVQETPVVQDTKETKTQPEQAQESFTDPVDLKTLEQLTPAQLLEQRKNWERAYSAKRQKETAEIKEYQRRINELEGKVPKQEEQQQSVEKNVEIAKEQVELGNMSVAEYTEYILQLIREENRGIAREEYQALIAEQEEKQLQQTAVKDFQSADSRLDPSAPDHNESFASDVQRELAELLDKHLETNGTYKGFDAKELTKAIVQKKDVEIDNIVKTRTQQSTEAARKKEATLRRTEVRGTSSDGQRVAGNSIRNILAETIDG